MIHASASLGLLLSSAALVAPAMGAAEPGRGMFDLLGGASWSQRHGEAIVGWTTLDVDGARQDQDAWYFSVAASAISGYQANDRPYGTILGLGTSLKAWWGNDQVDVRSVAPFVYGIAGVYGDFNARTRTELTARVGPGAAWSRIDDDGDFGLAWTWAVEGALSVTKGDATGIGVGVGYESVRVVDFSQDGPYVMLRIGF